MSLLFDEDRYELHIESFWTLDTRAYQEVYELNILLFMKSYSLDPNFQVMAEEIAEETIPFLSYTSYFSGATVRKKTGTCTKFILLQTILLLLYSIISLVAIHLLTGGRIKGEKYL